MASSSPFKRTSSNGRTSLLHMDPNYRDCGTAGTTPSGEIRTEAPLQGEFEALTISKRLLRSVSQKLRKKKSTHRSDGAEERKDERKISYSGCLGVYGKGGGCKVGACEEFDISCKRKSNTMEECMPNGTVSRLEKTGSQFFSHAMSKGMCRKNKNAGKGKVKEQPTLSSTAQFPLPDDLLEMCLARLPLPSLLTARLVCKKWRYLTTTPQFIQMRCEGSDRRPWLFLFGIVKDGCSAGEIHALDASLDRWHRIDADMLRGRFLFSVATVGIDLYVIGGCSSSNSSSAFTGKSPFKTHRGVLVFNPLLGTWRKSAPMRLARSGPIIGVFEVNSTCRVFHRHQDPHGFPRRRQQLRDIFKESNDRLPDSKRKPLKCGREGRRSKEPRHVLIAVGGHGSWDEPLDTGEIYDPVMDRWTYIPRLPGDFGPVCSGTVCNGMFYAYSEADKLAGYDLERGVWVVIQTSRTPPHLHEYHPKLVSCHDRLFMLSVSWCDRDRQFRREKAVRKLWELDLAFLAWTEVSRHPDAPMDWAAAFVADKNRIYGVEMFKIFGQVLDFLTVCDVSDGDFKWSRISRKHAANQVDASSCTTKLMAVLQL